MKREYSKGGVTKNHGHWRAYVSYIDGDGTRRMLTMQTPVACREKDNSGRTAALEHQRRWRDGLVREEERREESLSEALAARSELPFYDYAKDFLDHHAVAEVTEKGYRAALNILKGTPAGECPIGELTSDLLLDLEGQARAEGRKGSTLAKRRAFYAMVLKRAVTRGDIPSNPLEGVRAPRAGRKPVNSLDLEGQEAVLEKVEELGWEPVTIAARIALLTGMRRGEICALRWQDVDFSNSIVHVNHEEVVQPGRADAGVAHAGEDQRVAGLSGRAGGVPRPQAHVRDDRAQLPAHRRRHACEDPRPQERLDDTGHLRHGSGGLDAQGHGVVRESEDDRLELSAGTSTEERLRLQDARDR